jgi:hypothetical protein
MERTLEELVWERTGRCCEYCGMPQEYEDATLAIDHIIAASHGGPIEMVAQTILDGTIPFSIRPS